MKEVVLDNYFGAPEILSKENFDAISSGKFATAMMNGVGAKIINAPGNKNSYHKVSEAFYNNS